MTLAEIIRFIDSQKRKRKLEAQERASFDYTLADLIGRSIARLHSSSNTLPHIAEAYPNLFDKEEVDEKIQEKKDEVSAMRFRMFVESFNNNFKEGSKDE
jgi:hypothetical protein